jgi:cephalosporin-C deacetylase-like acetyl esterase
MDEDKQNMYMQEALAEYKRRLDVMRQQQADMVREFLEQKEKKQQEEIMNNLNA